MKSSNGFLEQVRDLFDESVTLIFENAVEKHTKPRTFFRGNKFALYNFCDPEAWDAVFLDEEVDVEKNMEHVERLVASSTIGSAMLEPEKIKLNEVKFLKSVEKRLDDLAELNWDADEINVFKTNAKATTQNLIRGGAKYHEKLVTKIEFLGGHQETETENANDNWQFRFDAKALTTAINIEIVKPLPWELLALRIGNIPGDQLFARIPAEVVEHKMDARHAAMDYLPKDTFLLKDMKNTINANSKDLRSYCRSWVLEETFLNDRAEGLITERVYDMVLDALPTEENEKTFQKALSGITAARRSPQARALGPDTERELDTIFDIVANLAQDIGPKKKDIDGYSVFFKSVIKRCEAFLRLDFVVRTVTTGSLMFPKKEKLVGQGAIRRLYEEISDRWALDEGKGIDIKELKPFKAYIWMLTEAEAEIARGWRRKLSATAIASDASMGCLADKQEGDAGAVVMWAGKAASSADAAVDTSVANTKKNKIVEDKLGTQRANMLKFFQPPVKK